MGRQGEEDRDEGRRKDGDSIMEIAAAIAMAVIMWPVMREGARDIARRLPPFLFR